MRPVLLCGGVGKKMWPMSRRRLPKHLLPLFSGKSLFQTNYEGLRQKFEPGEIYVQTNEEQAQIVKCQCPELPSANFFIEPDIRNHGPATGFMALKLMSLGPDEPFITVQADVLREPVEKFLQMLELCERLIKKSGKLVTGGIRPEYAIMGVDYLRVRPEKQVDDGINVYQMVNWLWRDESEAVIKKMVEEKTILTHANHYAWTPRLMLNSFAKHRPDWHHCLMEIADAFGKNNEAESVRAAYLKMAKGPLEEVTQEALKEGLVIECPFSWIDFGTWASLARYEEGKGTYRPTGVFELQSSGNYVRSDQGKFIGLIGVRDVIVIDTKDGLLICQRNQSGRVGEVVEYLNSNNLTQYT